ncbi:MAG: hypothetical protein WD696_10280 [Bryobacteraceae bacterium]
MRLFNLFVVLAATSVGAFGQKAALAVIEKVAGSVGFYSAEGQRVGGVKVNAHPHEMALSPDKRLLYVTDNGMLWMTDPGEGGNTVSIVDIAGRKKVGEINLGNHRRPHGIDVDPKSGRVIVTIENPDGLLLLDPVARKVLRKYDVRGEDPHMVLFGPRAQWAYASNTGTGTLAAVNMESGESRLIATGKRPQGAAFSLDSKTLFVTNSDSGTISIIDADKQEVTGTIATGKGPGRVALTSDGKTLVYNLQAGEAVGFADLATKKELKQIPLGGRPLSLTMSADRQIAYSSVQDQDKIFVISVPEKKILRVIQTPKGSGPDPVIPLL